jgi:hypothetical protein
MLDELVRISSRMIEIVEEPTLTRKGEEQRLRGYHTKLANRTGWTPKISLSQTLTDILQDKRECSGYPRSKINTSHWTTSIPADHRLKS